VYCTGRGAGLAGNSPVFSWTGFYIGGNGGGGSSHNKFNGNETNSTTLTGIPGVFPSTSNFSGSVDGGGAILGGQIGFNYEFPLSHVVIGVTTQKQAIVAALTLVSVAALCS
jgi:outer membrane immunogenic protein